MPASLVTGQQATGGAAAGSSVSATFPANVTPGNVIFACVSCTGSLDPQSNLPTGLTGGTWTLVRAQESTTNTRGQKALYKCVGATTGVTVTATDTQNGRMTMNITEWTGLDNTQDAGSPNSAEANSTAIDTGNLTTQNANDLVLAMAGFEGTGTVTETDVPPWVDLTQVDNGTSAHLRAAYQVVSSIATYHKLWTDTVNDDHAAIVIAFQSTAGGGPITETPSTQFELHSLKLK